MNYYVPVYNALGKLISLDFGDGEITAGYPDKQGTYYRVKRLDFDKNAQVLPTQLVLTKKQIGRLKGELKPTKATLSALGTIRIGRELVADPKKEEFLFLYFKKPPKDFDKKYVVIGTAKEELPITYGQLMACFAYAVITEILKYNSGYILPEERANTTLYVGCPSTTDWTYAKNNRAYAELLRRATGVKQVFVIPESRAALFSSFAQNRNLSRTLSGVLVLDFGSSTADGTYMLFGRALREFSWSLGASHIEAIMAKVMYAKAVETRGEMFDVQSNSWLDITRQLRGVKEAHYSGGYSPRGHAFTSVFEMKNSDDIAMEAAMINQSFMQRVVEDERLVLLADSTKPLQGSWMTLCEQFLKGAKEMLETNKLPLKHVILTGGASRMEFVHELTKKTFPDATIIREQEPSFTVSTGLCWAAITDIDFEPKQKNVRETIAGKASCAFMALQTSMVDEIFDYICYVVKDETKKWANQNGDTATVRELQAEMERRVLSYACQSHMQQLCEKKIQEWKATLSSEITKEVSAKVKEHYPETLAQNLILPNDIWKDLQADALDVASINMKGILENIDFSAFSRQVMRGITSLVIWTIGWFFAAETLLLSVLVAWIVDIYADEALSDQDLDKHRKKQLREKIAEKIEDSLKEKQEIIIQPIKKSFEPIEKQYDTMLDKTIERTFKIVMLQYFENS